MTIKSSQAKIAATPFFHRAFECLLVSEEDETGKYIFGLCFPIGPAATGRPHREPEAGRRARTDELGRQAAGELRSWPAGRFAEPAKR